MDSFELNKIAGAVLGSLLLILAVHKIVGIAFPEHEEMKKKAYIVEGVQEEGAEAAKPAPVKVVPLGNLLAAANPAKGEKISAQCKSCHTFTQGGPNMTGPNLFGIIGGPMAHKGDFHYSDAFNAEHAAGKTWTYEAIFTYLKSPKDFVPGNKMAFAGVKKDTQRADLVAYLKTISPAAPPFPPPEATPEPAGDAAAKPADGTAPAAPAPAAPAPAKP